LEERKREKGSSDTLTMTSVCVHILSTKKPNVKNRLREIEKDREGERERERQTETERGNVDIRILFCEPLPYFSDLKSVP